MVVKRIRTLLLWAYKYARVSISGSGGARRPGEDQGGAEDGHDSSVCPRARRAGRDERRGERRAAQRGRHQPAQRRGAHHRGAEERARQETATGRAAVLGWWVRTYSYTFSIMDC